MQHPIFFEEIRPLGRNILKILQKIVISCGVSSKFYRSFVQNRILRRNILKILKKIALPYGISSKFHRSFIQNRALIRSVENLEENRARVQSILKISSLLYSESRSRAERPEIFDEFYVIVRSILQNEKKFALPCGAFLEFWRFFIRYIRNCK